MQEFKIDSSVVTADERSQVTVSMVTKQGTNQFHGTAYEYNENKATAAANFDLKRLTNSSKIPSIATSSG